VALLFGIAACLVLAGLPIVLPDGDDCCAEAACCCSAVTAGSCCSSDDEPVAPSGPVVVAGCACGHASPFVHLPAIRALPAPAAVVGTVPAAPRAHGTRRTRPPLGRLPEPEAPVPRPGHAG
jgi:hypothetical protein